MNPKINAKDLFWDLNYEVKDIEEIISGDDFRAKHFLFEKILLNSQTMIRDFRNFSEDDLKILIESYEPKGFNKDYAYRRKCIVDTFFLDKPLTHPELQWRS